ncbi:M57 family metalloprotease [Pedobacter sp. UYP30]|uniref:M57 family metalloprotease n=1 Tax=Pedobacter sp. UYP30 TaxID=1756400 RepID=UPI0033909DEB
MLAILSMGCRKEVQQIPVQSLKNVDPVLSYIKSLGFKSTMIEDKGDEYLVEGDISFPKDMKLPSTQGIPRQGFGGNAGERLMNLPPNHDLWIEQYFTGNLVSTTTATNIKILVDGSMASLSGEINAAISQWNNVPNSSLHFSIVTGGVYDIYITDQNLGAGLCGAARFPISGTPGNLIRINKNEIASNSFEQRQRTIAHEMGHCIGFRHTNWQANGESQYGTDDVGTSVNAIDVPGVGGTDPYSIMNGGQCGSGATQLSAKDKLAAASLYPGSGSSGTLATMVGIDIGTDDGVYFWDLSGQVTKGNSTSIYGPTSSYVLPAGRTYNQVVDMAISNSGYSYVWYTDGIMSVGSVNNLGNFIAPKPYFLPAGKVPTDIVGIAILKSNDHCFTFYKDGTFSEGNSTNLAAYSSSQPYSVPIGETYTNIADIGIAASSGWFYAWYKDNKVSVGPPANLNSYIALKPVN